MKKLADIVPIDGRFETERRGDSQNSLAVLPNSGISITEYADLVQMHQDNLHNNPEAENDEPEASEFVETIDASFQTLLEERPIKEIREAMTGLVDYGVQQRKTFSETDLHPDTSAYMSWTGKLRQLAGLSLDYKPEPKFSLKLNNKIISSVDFWREVYGATLPAKFFIDSFEKFVLGPGIAVKDKSVLSNVAKSLDQYPVEDVFFNSPLVNSRSRLTHSAMDTFKQLVNEASLVGWDNAEIVETLVKHASTHEKLPPEQLLIWVANQVTSRINKKFQRSTDARLETFDINDLSNSSRAVRRIMDYVIKLNEHPPRGRDPLNYELTGQIVGKLFDHAFTMPEEAVAQNIDEEVVIYEHNEDELPEEPMEEELIEGFIDDGLDTLEDEELHPAAEEILDELDRQ